MTRETIEQTENVNGCELLNSAAIGQYFGLSESTIDILLVSYGFQHKVNIGGSFKTSYAPSQRLGAQHCEHLVITGYSEQAQACYRPLWKKTILDAFKAHL